MSSSESTFSSFNSSFTDSFFFSSSLKTSFTFFFSSSLTISFSFLSSSFTVSFSFSFSSSLKTSFTFFFSSSLTTTSPSFLSSFSSFLFSSPPDRDLFVSTTGAAVTSELVLFSSPDIPGTLSALAMESLRRTMGTVSLVSSSICNIFAFTPPPCKQLTRLSPPIFSLFSPSSGPIDAGGPGKAGGLPCSGLSGPALEEDRWGLTEACLLLGDPVVDVARGASSMGWGLAGLEPSFNEFVDSKMECWAILSVIVRRPRALSSISFTLSGTLLICLVCTRAPSPPPSPPPTCTRPGGSPSVTTDLSVPFATCGSTFKTLGTVATKAELEAKGSSTVEAQPLGGMPASSSPTLKVGRGDTSIAGTMSIPLDSLWLQ